MATKTRPSKAKKTNPSTPCNKSCQAKCTCKTGQKPDPSCEGKRLDDPEHGPEGTMEVGRGLAMEAIQKMENEAIAIRAADAQQRRQVEGFLDECKKAGKDPVEVVRRVAQDAGIDLTKDVADEPQDKKVVRKLLLAVLLAFLKDAISFAASEISSGNHDWAQMLKNYLNQRFGGVFKDEISAGFGDKAVGPDPVKKSRRYELNDLVLRKKQLFANPQVARIASTVLFVLVLTGVVGRSIGWLDTKILAGAGDVAAAVLRA